MSLADDENLQAIFESQKVVVAVATYPGYIYTENSYWNLYDDGRHWKLKCIIPSMAEEFARLDDARILIFKPEQ